MLDEKGNSSDIVDADISQIMYGRTLAETGPGEKQKVWDLSSFKNVPVKAPSL